MKILIADDQLIYRETLKSMLRSYGECVTVEDGEQAVQVFKTALEANDPFKLVLLDIQMPHMDGQEALLQIRQLEQRKYGSPLHTNTQAYTYILMQTSLEDPQQLTQAFRKGRCNGYITKPVEWDDLQARLKKAGLL